MHIAEAGRLTLAAQLAIMEMHQAALLRDADTAAIYETRKAIRRTFTAFKLFQPFFTPAVLAGYHRGWKKIMRRLGLSRDITVFLAKLALFRLDVAAPADVAQGLAAVEGYWQARKAAADAALFSYLQDPRRQDFLAAYKDFSQTPGAGVLAPTDPGRPITPAQVIPGHYPLSTTHFPDPAGPMTAAQMIPALIEQRIAAVYAYEGHLDGVTIEQLHQVRIQCKELRYSLEFFAPLLGPEIIGVVAVVKALQEHLGALNDANVALRLLAQTPVSTPAGETAVALYRAAKETEIGCLMDDFGPRWQEFIAPAWRQNLAAALASL
jgi:CHAD domain-containing protein